MADPEKLTMKEILGSLTLPQLGSLIGVVIAMLTGAFGVGAKFSEFSQSQPDLVPCARAENYPLGIWLVSGDERSESHASLAQSVVVDTPQTAKVYTNEDTGQTFVFQIGSKIEAGKNVSFVGTDGAGYTGYFTGRVSDSGCSIEGVFSDTKRHHGTETLFWYEPKYYWVLRKHP
jgi:hypothetical protein